MASKQDFAHTFIGTERYRPIRLLGVGGMGVVYEVEDTLLGTRAALKQMKGPPSPERVLQLKQEFRAVAELSHPHLVRVYDLVFDRQQWFFTMELVDGHSLATALRSSSNAFSTVLGTETSEDIAWGREDARDDARPANSNTSLTDTLAWLEQLLDALGHLHAHGVIHRDVKPSNVLIDAEGRARLLDFGLATPLSHQEPYILSRAGTRAYMAPELFRGHPPTEASDLYALGCIAYELLIGARYLPDSPALTTLRPELDPALTRAVDALLHPEPRQRPALDALRHALGLRAMAHPRRTRELGELVSRDAELDALERALFSPHGAGFAMLEGSSGMGKSTLSRVIEEGANERDFICLRGRCYEREQVAFTAFDRLIDALALTLSQRPELTRELTRPLAAMAPVFPVLAVLPGVQDAHIDRPLAQRQAIAQRAFTDVLQHLARDAPLLLILDDLHWADSDSLALLEHLVSALPRASRVRILALLRPRESWRHPERIEILRARATLTSLEALDEDASRALAEGEAGRALSTGELAALTQLCAGNPFLISRLAPHALDLVADTRLTDDVLFHLLCAELGDDAHRVLHAMGVAVGSVSEQRLLSIADLELERFDRALDELLRARLVKRLPEGRLHALRLDIEHDRIRDLIDAHISDDARAALHTAWAELLEPGTRPADVEARLYHWTALGRRDKRLRDLPIAAENAADQFAFSKAARLYTELLEVLDPDDPRVRGDALWRRVGRLHELAGELREAADAFRAALERAPAERRDALALTGDLAENLLATGQLEEGFAVLEPGLRAVGMKTRRGSLEQIAVMLRLLAQRQIASRSALPERTASPEHLARLSFLHRAHRLLLPLVPSTAAEATLRGLVSAARQGPPEHYHRFSVLGEGARGLALALSPKQLQAALRCFEEARAFATERDDPALLANVERALGFFWLARDPDASQSALLSAEERFAELGLEASFDASQVKAGLVGVYSLWDRQAELKRVLEQTPFLPNHNTRAFCIQAELRAALRVGDLERARDHIAHLDTLLQGYPPAFLTWELLQMRLTERLLSGEPADAVIDHYMRVRQGFVDAGLHRLHSFWLSGLTPVLEAVVNLARRGLATDAHARLGERIAMGMMRRGLPSTRAFGLRGWARLEHLRGRRASARGAILTALELPSKQVIPYIRWLTLEAAREIGLRRAAEEAEGRRLRARHGFVFYDPELNRR